MKRILLFLTILVGYNCYSQYPTNGLVAQYGFDNGSLLVDGANGINLTQTGAALTEINNRFGNTPTSAVALNGDYLTRADINFPSVNNLEEFITLSFWVKTATNDSNTRVIINDSNRPDVTNTSWAGYYLYLQNGKIGAILGVQYNGAISYKSGGVLANKIISDGNWHHVAVTLSRSDNFAGCCTYTLINSLTLYIDGVSYGSGGNSQSTASGSLSLLQTHDTSGNISIGNNRSNTLPNTNKYSDAIDDILFYNRILTPTEIANIANYNNFCFTPASSIIYTTNITDTTASLTISESGTFDIAYHKASEPFSNAVFINGITTGIVNLTGLDIFTDYKVYIQKNCSNNVTGWSFPINFKTKRTLGKIYVNANATGNNNGISWSNAFTKLENALAVAQDNEEIWIASGTYTPNPTNRAAYFGINRNNLKLYGGFLGNETLLSQRDYRNNITILSGDLQNNDNTTLSFSNTTKNDNSYNIIVANAENITLDGLTISGAYANGSTPETKSGGAIYKVFTVSNLNISNCIIQQNIVLDAAAGIYARYDANGTLKIHNCIFKDNLSRYGSAIYSYSNTSRNATIEVVNSLFCNNVVKDNGASLGYAGSAGWYRAYGANSTMNLTFYNNTFTNNEDTGTTSGMNNFNRGPIGISYDNTGIVTASLANTIFWGNTGVGAITSKSIVAVTSTLGQNISVKNSIAEDGFTNIPISGVLNVSNSNPMFTNPGNNDFTLLSSSPAIDTGNNINVIGTTDLSGNMRIHNATVDMGAYEFGAAALGIPSYISENKFTVFPNPTTSILNIQTNATITQIDIINLNGKQILSTAQKKIDVSNLPSGLYLIKITSKDNQIVIQKFFKQ